MVNNYFIHNSMYFVLAKSIDGRFSVAAKTLLRTALLDASIADNIEDIENWWRESKSDAARFSPGKISFVMFL